MNAKSLLLALGLTTLVTGCATHSASKDPWVKQFHRADANNDGKVAQQEFGAIMIEDAFILFDVNKDGIITRKEFLAAGGKPASFAKIDVNRNGVITLEEAKSAKVAMDAMTIAFYGADADKDGFVTLAEALEYRDKARAYTR